MKILKDLPELTKAGVITQETANKIKDYYNFKSNSSINRLFIVFGILGALLVGLGIILIIAHNWDQLSRSTKTIFAFLPLLIGQILCFGVLIKNEDGIAWRESATTFLFFSVGACISLISQIYNLSGDLGSFVLTWMLLCLPLIYVMKSSIASLLYIIGITYYAVHTSNFSFQSSESYLYWVLLLLTFPHYYQLYKLKPSSNFMIFHNWLVPLSLIIALGTVAKTTSELIYIAYFSLYGSFYLIGDTDFFTNQKRNTNGYKIIGSLGTIFLLLILSFDASWEGLREKEFQLNEIVRAPEFYASTLLTFIASGLLYFHQKNKSVTNIKPISSIFILFIIAFIIGLFSPISVLLINIYVFAIGIVTIIEGVKKDHLGILNYGLLIITALIICRFFDTDLSFVVRGVLFVLVGSGFFTTNYLMFKKRKIND